MFKNIIFTCFLGMLAIILGAFGAHVLKETLTADQLLSFETAVRYQIYHVIVLLIVNMYAGFSSKQKNTISYLFFAGIFLFSGSIYAIQLTAISAKSIWFVTPLGGLFLIIGWISMIIIFSKKMRNR
ncbi:DUF423 domain-containing protein [Polaribacter cellanae]|uniref:DUF423 domain-containing protein n=1 Tax=Polaribacter cellanae TaxID=2818493 RepID=A0A975H8C7_9FLAO|nr:DUF423 domain-containing protein [Polaribacter cellanae]QTE23909.1 DUF423 domain-containing protein [Polaribacter cellanae]